MSMIIGMDTGVFLAWILTILAAILCVLYGIYNEFFKDDEKEKTKKHSKTKTKSQKKEEK